MGTVELKKNIHLLVEGIENEATLQVLFQFLNDRKKNESSIFWDGLTNAQKQEILLAFEESDSENNLIERDTFFKYL
jgi:hypothetical protein